MPSDYINGKDVILYVLVGGVYRQVACYTTVSLEVQTETLEVTTRRPYSSKKYWREYRPIVNTWSGSCEGVKMLDSVLRFSDMRQFQIDGQAVLLMFSETSSSMTRQESWIGYAVITSTSSSGDVNDPAPFSITFQGNGELQSDFEPIDLNAPVEMYEYYTCIGNEGNVIVFNTGDYDLRGTQPVGRIYRGGYAYEPSGSTAKNRPATDTPVGYQYQWDPVLGKMTFDPAFPNLNANERIIIPYTEIYSGCSLSISGLSVSVNGNNQFYFQWTGTGIRLTSYCLNILSITEILTPRLPLPLIQYLKQ